MDKRYQVFVSSTYEDLREERQEVMQALLELNCIPTGMELFPAADEDSWTLIKNFISECDYYLVIVGGRYGSLGSGGKSYTEMEYEFAVETGIPVLGFLHENPDSILAGKTEATEQGKASLAEFRKRIKSRGHCRSWSSSKDLGGVVSRGIANLTKVRPGIGWVRANLVANESAAQEILKLRDKIAELESQMKHDALRPPLGAEDLAQGDDSVALTCSFTINGQDLEQRYDFTWNTLLALMGPILLNAANEYQLKELIADAVQNRFSDSGSRIYRVLVRDEDFQRVKVQFRALGWIVQTTGPLSEMAYWRLTPHGDAVMTQVAAIKANKSDGPTPNRP